MISLFIYVNSEEWEWLVKKENLRESLTNATHQQRLFIEQIAVTARRLFTYMEVPEEEAANHRFVVVAFAQFASIEAANVNEQQFFVFLGYTKLK